MTLVNDVNSNSPYCTCLCVHGVCYPKTSGRWDTMNIKSDNYKKVIKFIKEGTTTGSHFWSVRVRINVLLLSKVIVLLNVHVGKKSPCWGRGLSVSSLSLFLVFVFSLYFNLPFLLSLNMVANYVTYTDHRSREG